MTDDFSDIFDDEPTPAPAALQPRIGRPRTRDKYPEVQAEQSKMYDFYQSPEGQRRIRMASTGAFHESVDTRYVFG